MLSVLLGAGAMRAAAATRTVTSTADSGAGTLRDTVAAAAVGDTITFGGTAFVSPITSVTIRLTTGRIIVDKPLTINGIDNARGATKIILTGDTDNSDSPTTGDSGIFKLSAGSSAVPAVTIYNLKFDRGFSAGTTEGGGALWITGAQDVNVVCNHCLFTDNSSGGAGGAIVWSKPSGTDRRLTLTDCNFSGNASTAGLGGGGAVSVSTHAILECTNCDFTGNSATLQDGGALRILNSAAVASFTDCSFDANIAGGDGGGVEVSGSALTVTACTLSNNSAGGQGGGLHINNTGSVTKQLLLKNSTLSGNTTRGNGGGLCPAYINLAELDHCTVTGNTANDDDFSSETGGGIGLLASATVSLKASIVAGNKISAGGYVGDDLGVLTSQAGASIASGGGNLIGNASGAAGIFTVAGDLAGTSGSPVKARLGALALNGGTTKNHLPDPLSPAVHRGGISTLSTDQRGLPRNSPALSDAGSVEVQLTSYAVWATAKITSAAQRAADLDPDKDSLPNLLEYLYGTDPAAVTPSPFTVTRAPAGSVTLSWPLSLTADPADYGLKVEETPGNLLSWTTVSLAELSTGAVNATTLSASLTLPPAAGAKHFYRLKTVRP